MNVAILHYHFNRGGVTQVVLNQLRAIDGQSKKRTSPRFALIHGGRSAGIAEDSLSGFGQIELSQHAIAALDYDDGGAAHPAELASEITRVLRSCNMPPGDTLLHVHNHSLGKNVSLPGAVALLAKDGYRFLLQIHDFAEDFRPENYRRLANATPVGDAAASNSKKTWRRPTT